jgi:Mrp family chromosome partitioning ATPase
MAVSRLSMESGLLPDNVAPAQTEEFLERLKQTFDLTLIDSWSVSIPAKPTLFSPHVDGVVLVIDEGKTRWQIIEQQKRDLISQGANVLGVVLNNRTYPIPDSIYERL